MKQRVLAYFLLLVPPAYIFVSLWGNMLGDPFPPFNDPGIWLKLAHAIEGNAYPMWGETTYQYPPLFPAILGLGSSLTGHPLTSEKILGAGAIALISLSSYPLTKALTGSRWLAIIGVWLVAFAPIFQEMFGWGGYPDALGVIFLTLAMGYAVVYYAAPTRRNLILLVAFSFLTPLAHHLTFIMFAGGFAIASLLLLLVTRERKKFYAPLLALAGGGAGFAVWRGLAGPFQYELYNGASLAIRPLDVSAIQFTFKSFYLLGALVVLAALGGFWLYRRGKYFELALLVSMAIVPYLAAQSYLIGIALDFRRYPAFSAIPLSVLAVISLCWLRDFRQGTSLRLVGGKDPKLEGSVSLTKVALALAFLFLLVGTIQIGVQTEAGVFAYYHYETDYAYQGTNRLQAINWLKANTSKSAVVVADETLGRWTEGYGQRRVLLDLAPYQSFITGEVPRAIAADLILNSNVEISNPSIRMRDGTPYQLMQTPVFAYSDGLNYHDTLYVTDAYVRASFTRAGSNWVEAPYNPVSFNMSWTSRKGTNTTMTMNYETQGLYFIKSMSMGLYSPSATVTYTVVPKNGSALESLSLPIWVPYGSSTSSGTVNSTTYSVVDNGVEIYVTPLGAVQSVNFGSDNSTGQQRLLLTYASTGGMIRAGFRIEFPTSTPIAWRSTMYSATSEDLISQYNVSYIMISVDVYDASRFHSDPRFTQVFSNSQIAIFQVAQP